MCASCCMRALHSGVCTARTLVLHVCTAFGRMHGAYALRVCVVRMNGARMRREGKGERRADAP